MDSDAPNWEGLPSSSEHRTVGPHRAWCFQDSEWCYPDSLCPCCDQVRLPERWQGLNVGDVLEELRAKVEALPWIVSTGPDEEFVFKADVLALIDGKSDRSSDEPG